MKISQIDPSETKIDLSKRWWFGQMNKSVLKYGKFSNDDRKQTLTSICEKYGWVRHGSVYEGICRRGRGGKWRLGQIKKSN